jgi:hypothetical protein
MVTLRRRIKTHIIRYHTRNKMQTPQIKITYSDRWCLLVYTPAFSSCRGVRWLSESNLCSLFSQLQHYWTLLRVEHCHGNEMQLGVPNLTQPARPRDAIPVSVPPNIKKTFMDWQTVGWQLLHLSAFEIGTSRKLHCIMSNEMGWTYFDNSHSSATLAH